jgi:hypothetical protein
MTKTTAPSIEAVQELFHATAWLLAVLPTAGWEVVQPACERAQLALFAICKQTGWTPTEYGPAQQSGQAVIPSSPPRRK